MPTLASKDRQGMFMAVLFVIVRKRKIKRGRRDRGGEERRGRRKEELQGKKIPSNRKHIFR